MPAKTTTARNIQTRACVRTFGWFIGFVCLCGLVLAKPVQAQFMVVGIDRKFAAVDGKRQTLEPGHDALSIFDLTDPAKPARVGELTLENSLVGPPTNVAITPGGRLALVANAVHAERSPDGASWKTVPADEVWVVDLTARPIRLIGAVKVGAQPSGLAVDPAGKFALVASQADKSVTALSIRGQEVRVAGVLPMGEVVNAVAVAPDGRSALVTKLHAHKVAQLAISSEGKLTDLQRDVPVGLYPWNVAITPDGQRALVNNFGDPAGADGHADTVTVLDLSRGAARVVQHVTVGDAPEGLAISPRGDFAAVTLLQGSYDAPPGAWFRHDTGRVVMLRLAADGVTVAGGSDVGALPESVGISPDGRYVYAGNFADRTLSVLGVGAGGEITDRHDLPLPGPPASLRIMGGR